MTPRDELAAELVSVVRETPLEISAIHAIATHVLTLLSAAEARGREDGWGLLTTKEMDAAVLAFRGMSGTRAGVFAAIMSVRASRRASQPVVAVELFDERSG